MTEEERMREVERISRRTQKSVKLPPEQQEIIRIVRYKAGNMRTYTGTLEKVTQEAKKMECLYGPIEQIV